MEVTERFLKYVMFDTQSDPESRRTPSSKGQLIFGRELVNELIDMGLEEISFDNNGYIMATVPANTDKKTPTIGFIAHMDTSPDMCGRNVNPRIVKNYDGSTITLNKKDGIILSPEEFPELTDHIGEDLIVTNGKTLLGADDKAGIAEILTAVDYLLDHPEIKHGKIRIAFTPDEEIGEGADHFDIEKFGAEWAYTVDGGEVGELEYENFNAATAKITIQGRNVHPGTAKNKMVNSLVIANKLLPMLPEDERPENTEGYEGFTHLIGINGTVDSTTLTFIIRDHDKTLFESKKRQMEDAVKALNKLHADSTILEIKDQYYNMREMVEPQKHIVDFAGKAMEIAGIKPVIKPIRGGTDGARLSYMGLPCPNIFTGGLNFHGRYEFIPIQSMEKAVKVIVNIIKLVAEN